MNISRIDQASTKTHGFYVRVRRQGVLHAKFFPDGRHGGTEAARAAAEGHDAALLAEWMPSQGKRLDPRNTSGVTGVSRGTHCRNGGRFWAATWTDREGHRRHVQFSVNKYGEEEAKRRAIEARRAGMESKDTIADADRGL